MTSGNYKGYGDGYVGLGNLYSLGGGLWYMGALQP